jgi:hypothetical protein
MSGAAQAQTTQYFPQLADGGGYVTTWYLTGLGSAPSTITIEFFTQSGAPLSLPTNLGTNSTFTLSVSRTGETSIRTLGTNRSVEVGWARVTSSQPTGAAEIFRLYDANGGLISEAGVLPADVTSAGTLLISESTSIPGRNTGIALVNTSSSTNTITLKAIGTTGALVAMSEFQLAPGNQVATFLYELPNFDQFGDFEGSIEVTGSAQFSAVTLLYDGQEFSTLPVLPARVP